LPEVLGDIHGNVEKGEVSNGKALALEAAERGVGEVLDDD
jgi:hypothetical protein